MKANAEKKKRNEGDERRTEELSEPLRELFRVERHRVGEREKENRVDKLCEAQGGEAPERRFQKPGALERRAHHHLKGRARRAGNCQARSDRKIDEERKEKRKARVHAGGECRESPRLRHRHDAEDGKADGGDEKARKRRGHVDTRLHAEKRRENEVPSSEEHGKKRQADEEPLGKTQGGDFLHEVSFLLWTAG